VVEAPADIDGGLGELLDGCHQLPAPASTEQIVVAVQSLAKQDGELGRDDA